MIETGDIPEVAVMMDCEPYDMTWPAHWKIHHSDEHLEMQRALNALFKLYPNEETYGLITDHSRPETKDWARKIEAATKPRSMTLVNDTKNRMNPDSGQRRITSASCYGGDLIRDLGWVWLDTVTHMYGDDALERIGNALGCVTYLDDVIVRDLLIRDGEIIRDENHRRLYRGKPYIRQDKEAYTEWLEGFPQLIKRLEAY